MLNIDVTENHRIGPHKMAFDEFLIKSNKYRKQDNKNKIICAKATFFKSPNSVKAFCKVKANVIVNKTKIRRPCISKSGNSIPIFSAICPRNRIPTAIKATTVKFILICLFKYSDLFKFQSSLRNFEVILKFKDAIIDTYGNASIIVSVYEVVSATRFCAFRKYFGD